MILRDKKDKVELKEYEEIIDNTKYFIKIKSNNSNDYDEKFIKFSIISNDYLPLEKISNSLTKK